MDRPSTLDERYGRTPGAARRRRWLFLGAALAFALVLVGWLVWAGLGPAAQLQARDTGFHLHDESRVSIQWRLTVAPGTETRCALQALNSTFGIVGWKVVDVPASELSTRQLSATVLTTEQAVTGLIYRCWLA